MGREENRERSIKAIRKAALSLFVKKGFTATTTDEIAAKAKVSKGLIYFYFSSKEEILMQLIEDAFKEVEGQMSEEDKPFDIIQELLKGFKASLKKPEQWQLIMSVLFQTHKKSAVKRLLKEKYLHYIQRLSQQFEKLGSENPQAEARVLIAIMDGLALQATFAADLIEAEKVMDHIFQQYKNKYQP